MILAKLNSGTDGARAWSASYLDRQDGRTPVRQSRHDLASRAHQGRETREVLVGSRARLAGLRDPQSEPGGVAASVAQA
ncbi:MAG TPA: hypothetical protein VNF47_06900 [Streptosporangiaceae bacterium]|nr:hypothetical protein [Streptosporangiaceae bacterium]